MSQLHLTPKQVLDRISRKRRFVRNAKITLAIVLGVLIIGVTFIKLDTGAAAQFTDNVLRPLLGSRNVLVLEKLFFNITDDLTRTSYKVSNKKPDSPIVAQSAPAFPTPSVDPKTPVQTIPANYLTLKKINLNYFPTIEGENHWHYKPVEIFAGQPVMAYTFVRPDKDRPFVFTTITEVDGKRVAIGSVAGTKEPAGAVGKPGPGVVPKEIIDSGRLIAAFDGGFQYKDGQYGMIVGDKTYLPLKNDLGTIVGYNDGTVKIVNYIGQDLGSNVAFVRQNCPILIENGDITTIDPKIKALWGRTLTTDIYTWRSGIGLTQDGNILYAVGNNLTPTTLAEALKAAGAVNAIQLDINPYWVRFNLFNPIPGKPGEYNSEVLTKGLQDGSKEYLHGYQKDFFYLYKKD